MTSAPLVSACVPTYNGAEFLAPCIESLLAQSLKDIEIVISDDGSTDETLEIIRSFADPRIRVLPTSTRAGMAGNWNRCIGEARGKYVCLVAQDDLVKPQWAERLSGLLEAHPEADLAFGRRDFEISDENAREVTGGFFTTEYPAMLKPFYDSIDTVIPPQLIVDAAMKHRFEVNLIGEPSFTMVRSEHHATQAGYNLEMKQMLDWEFATRFFAEKPILHCAEVLGSYRIHSAGASVGNAPMTLQYREYNLLLDIILPRFEPLLTANQEALLVARREEFHSQLLAHAKIIEEEREQLLAHASTLESERDGLRAHIANLERELPRLQIHVETLEGKSGHLRTHTRNLESQRSEFKKHIGRLETNLKLAGDGKLYRALHRIKRFLKGS